MADMDFPLPKTPPYNFRAYWQSTPMRGEPPAVVPYNQRQETQQNPSLYGCPFYRGSFLPESQKNIPDLGPVTVDEGGHGKGLFAGGLDLENI